MKKASYIKKLNDIIAVVSDVAMGDLSKRIEVEGEDEFAALGMAINEMIDTMNRYRTEMTEKLIAVVSDVAMGDLSKQVEVIGEDEFAALGLAINEMISGLKEKEFIRDSFGKYVTKQVVDELLKGRLNLGGERVEVTILMSDIRKFTTISEKEKPEDVVRLLNEYFTMMVNKILQYGGTIDKFIGDGILTIFGAPIRHQDHAQRAIEAAIAMQRELAVFNKKRVKAGLPPIKVGMAINSGEAIVGNIGSDLKMEYTVIGDTVNVTARVEELNKKFKTNILITHSAYTRATKRLTVRKLDPIVLRGRRKLTQLYELKGIET